MEYSEYAKKLTQIVTLLNELTVVSQDLGIKNLSQTGIIKEIILSNCLSHIVNPEKHNCDAIGKSDNIDFDENQKIIIPNEADKIEYSNSSLSLSKVERNIKKKDGRILNTIKYENPKYQLDRVNDMDDVYRRYEEINKLILATWCYELPLLPLRILEVNLDDSNTRKCILKKMKGDAKFSANHLNFSVNPNKIYSDDLLRQNITLVMDQFRDLSCEKINELTDCKDYNFTYKIGSRSNESCIIFNNRKPDEKNVFSIDIDTGLPLFLVVFDIDMEHKYNSFAKTPCIILINSLNRKGDKLNYDCFMKGLKSSLRSIIKSADKSKGDKIYENDNGGWNEYDFEIRGNRKVLIEKICGDM